MLQRPLIACPPQSPHNSESPAPLDSVAALLDVNYMTALPVTNIVSAC